MGIGDLIRGLFSRSVSEEELPELKVLALLQVTSKNLNKVNVCRRKDTVFSFRYRKDVLNVRILFGGVVEALQGVQALTTEVQQQAELTFQRINSFLKQKNSVGVIPGTKEYNTFQGIKIMKSELEWALLILGGFQEQLKEPQVENKGWHLYLRGRISLDDFQSLRRRLADLERNLKELIKLIARSAAMK